MGRIRYKVFIVIVTRVLRTE